MTATPPPEGTTEPHPLDRLCNAEAPLLMLPGALPAPAVYCARRKGHEPPHAHGIMTWTARPVSPVPAAEDDAVEKAARAIHAAHRPTTGPIPSWDDDTEAWQETYRDFARAALDAAGVPALRAEALREFDIATSYMTERDEARRQLADLRAERGMYRSVLREKGVDPDSLTVPLAALAEGGQPGE